MSKYKVMLDKMMSENKELFDEFTRVHAAFAENMDANKVKFNEVGTQIQEVVRKYERILCNKTESGQYSKFSSGLSEKFWAEIRTVYPKIDFIGIR